MLLVARLGGYLNRRNDGPPGHQTIWEGYARLATGAQVIGRIAENGEASAVHPHLAKRAKKLRDATLKCPKTAKAAPQKGTPGHANRNCLVAK
ncbi:MAG: hypothetical protein OXE85_12355 [Roseovarius sp.]|nr:hypothetical protein [Roseovarius sp.]